MLGENKDTGCGVGGKHYFLAASIIFCSRCRTPARFQRRSAYTLIFSKPHRPDQTSNHVNFSDYDL